MPEIPIPEAAEQLGLHASRVRALVARGDLRARKLGSRWLVDQASVQARRERGASDGRPFTARVAWAYLLLLSGEQVPWLDPASRSRLRARLRNESVLDVAPRLRRRARVEHFRASRSARSQLRARPGFVRSGITAAGDYGASISAADQLDGYVPGPWLPKLAYQFALEPVAPLEANLILRVAMWPAALQGRRVAPAGVVAVDLLEAEDQRTARAGKQLAERLRADRSQPR